jgi:NTE family protein
MPNSQDRYSGAPVEYLPSDREVLEPGTALCLSGGGYRAMVFHVGVMWRLYEAQMLKDLKRISSVSGGSITAAVLGLAWPNLPLDAAPDRARLEKHFVDPVRRLAGETIDATGIIGGVFLPGSVSDRIQAAYRKRLFGEATLQDLPDEPRFVINATNVQSGALWRFRSRTCATTVWGRSGSPPSLAAAVAASSAFPPVLSPMVMELTLRASRQTRTDLQREPYTSRVVLTDGGVYDNLGLGDRLQTVQDDLRQRRGRQDAARGGAEGGLGAPRLPGARSRR